MLKKFTNKKGFTLMEMLIVVAIIAILVAIAIPTFTSTMKKAKAGVDLANIRAGYANAQILAMTENSNAARTYYLKEDGTVGTSSDSKDYVCKASSTDATDLGKVGGTHTVTWNENQKITYEIEANTNTVKEIKAVTSTP